MNLCMDIGNSSVAYSIFDDKNIIIRDYFKVTEDLDYSDIKSHFINIKNDKHYDINSIIISSVDPKQNEIFSLILSEVFSLKIKLFTDKKHLFYEYIKDSNIDLKELGDDLLADVIAGVNSYGNNLLIVDIGTASKILYVNENYSLYSVNILPGLRLCQKSLSKDTALLPSIELKVPTSIIANNTIDSMNTGLIYGHIDMIDGLINRYQEYTKRKLKVIVTGGNSHILKPLFNKDYIIDVNLTLKGINYANDKE